MGCDTFLGVPNPQGSETQPFGEDLEGCAPAGIGQDFPSRGGFLDLPGDDNPSSPAGTCSFDSSFPGTSLESAIAFGILGV